MIYAYIRNIWRAKYTHFKSKYCHDITIVKILFVHGLNNGFGTKSLELFYFERPGLNNGLKNGFGIKCLELLFFELPGLNNGRKNCFGRKRSELVFFELLGLYNGLKNGFGLE